MFRSQLRGVIAFAPTPFTAQDVAFTFTFPASGEYGGALAPTSLALKGAQAYHDGTADSIRDRLISR